MVIDKNKIIKIQQAPRYNKDYILLMICCTSVCNYNCYYCYNKEHREQFGNIFIDFDALLTFINELHNKSNAYIILEILGGEPTLHPGLLEFCRKIQCLNYIISTVIYSNLTCSLEYIAQFNNFNKITFEFSYHAINNKINSSFIEKINTINKCKLLNNFAYSVMYEKNNLTNSIFVYTLLNNLKIKNGLLVPEYISNVSSAEFDTCELNEYYSIKDIEKYKLLTAKYNDLTRENSPITIYTCDNKIYTLRFVDYILLRIDPYKKCICDAGYNLYYIDFFGDIYKCEPLGKNKNFLLGNISKFQYEKIRNKQNISICESHICCFQNSEYNYIVK